MESEPAIDLRNVSSDDLRAELARRKEAARAKGRPMRYATKAEWAEARALELRATLAEVNGSHQPGSSGARRKGNQQDALRAEIDKFERLAKVFRRKGE